MPSKPPRRQEDAGKYRRTRARKAITDVGLSEWKPLRFVLLNGDSEQWIITSDGRLLRVNMAKLRQELSPQTFALLQALLDELWLQGSMAHYAVALAHAEIRLNEVRIPAGKEAIAARKKQAKAKRAELQPDIDRLQREANRLREQNPHTTNQGILDSIMKTSSGQCLASGAPVTVRFLERNITVPKRVSKLATKRKKAPRP